MISPDIFQHSLEAYRNHITRPGYKQGWFSFLRHRGNHKSLKQLQKDILASPDQLETLIKDHLLKRKKAANNHSFVMYLLDELKNAYPEQDWSQFDPKPLVMGNGLLYRGTASSPTHVFRNGFLDYNPSEKIDDYLADMNGSVGISTTRDFSIAHTYALPRIQLHCGDITNNNDIHLQSYIYKINYRGLSGIDIEGTAKARSKRFSAWCAQSKKEINIIGKIETADIEGAWKVFRDNREKVWIPNPHYKLERTPDLDKEPIVKLLAKKVICYLKNLFSKVSFLK